MFLLYFFFNSCICLCHASGINSIYSIRKDFNYFLKLLTNYSNNFYIKWILDIVYVINIYLQYLESIFTFSLYSDLNIYFV